jgi:hypothetical protein
MGLLPADFKSAASADFAIRAYGAGRCNPILSKIRHDQGVRDEIYARDFHRKHAAIARQHHYGCDLCSELLLHPWQGLRRVGRTGDDTFADCA